MIKATFRLLSAALVMVFMALPGIIRAQDQNPMLQPLPVDTAVRIGKLPNGLTYYIRHNEYPKGQADFYIAQNVGSILEEDSQSGLAHFLEHMCFNGTTNFPGNLLRDWLESIGVEIRRQPQRLYRCRRDCLQHQQCPGGPRKRPGLLPSHIA